jgi:hypothetical protein
VSWFMPEEGGRGMFCFCMSEAWSESI